MGLKDVVLRELQSNENLKYCVVVDCDDFSSKILYEERGQVFMKSEIKSRFSKCDDQIAAGFEENIANDNSESILAMLKRDAAANKAIRRYLISDKRMDEPLFEGDSKNIITCSMLETVLSKCKTNIDSFCKKILKSVNDELCVDSFKIIVVGKASACLFVKNYYSENFSYTSLLADSKVSFVMQEYSEESFILREEGTKPQIEVYFYSNEDLKSSVEAPVFDEDEEDVVYVGPFFTRKQETINLLVDEQEQSFDVPGELISDDCGLIELSFYLNKKKEIVVRTRNYAEKDKAFEAVIEL